MRFSNSYRDRVRAMAIEAWPTEGALCDAFAAKARAEGFVVHVETSGWDLLLVDETGRQIGVEAKLRANMDVLVQSLGHETKGPDVHAVLIPCPRLCWAFCRLALHLRITILDGIRILIGDVPMSVAEALRNAPLWQHEKPAWVPPYEVMGLGGGRASPIRITPWKVAAIELCRRLRSRGYLTREDFKEQRVSPAWWVTGASAALRTERVGKQFRYLATGEQLPDERWPELADAAARNVDDLQQHLQVEGSKSWARSTHGS